MRRYNNFYIILAKWVVQFADGSTWEVSSLDLVSYWKILYRVVT